MSLLIRNARILTLAPPSGSIQTIAGQPRRGRELRELAIIPAGDVFIDEGKIVEVGPKVEAPADTAVLEAHGRVLMPGFVDCHTHVCWAGDRLDDWEKRLRGISHQKILQNGGGIQSTVIAVRAATKKQLAAHLKERLAAMLREGTTTVEIKSGYGLQTEAELKMLRAIVRAGHEWPGTIVPTALLGHAFEGDLEVYARMVLKEMWPAVAKEFPGITVDAVCEEGSWTKEACVKLFEKVLKHHPVRVHSDHFKSLGMIPEAIRLGARSVDYLEAAPKADLTALAKSLTMGVILPCTGFHVNGRYARAGDFVDQGGALALATNCNPGSSPSHSMPLAIALAVRFCGLTPAEAIVAATVNAAAVLQLSDRGSIIPGQRADLLLLEHKDERSLAYELGGNPVNTVICAGQVVPR